MALGLRKLIAVGLFGIAASGGDVSKVSLTALIMPFGVIPWRVLNAICLSRRVIEQIKLEGNRQALLF